MDPGLTPAQVESILEGRARAFPIVAGATCGDIDVTQKVSVNVIPSDYVVTGSLSLAIQGRRVVGSLHFPETRLRIRVKPSQASWDAVNALLAEKQGVCGFVLEKVDVPSILSNVTEAKGFNVRLPLEKLKPFVVPAGVRDSVTVGGRTLAVSAETRTLRIDPDAIWYSASVRVEGGGP